jgi:hypothetical protein
MAMRILDLPLKREWYEMIERGMKTEEYRAIKPYWCKRLARCVFDLCWARDDDGQCHFRNGIHDLNRLSYTHVRFRYGYTKRTMLYALDGIRIGRCKPEWGAPEEKDVFILKLGNRL